MAGKFKVTKEFMEAAKDSLKRFRETGIPDPEAEDLDYSNLGPKPKRVKTKSKKDD